MHGMYIIVVQQATKQYCTKNLRGWIHGFRSSNVWYIDIHGIVEISFIYFWYPSSKVRSILWGFWRQSKLYLCGPIKIFLSTYEEHFYQVSSFQKLCKKQVNLGLLHWYNITNRRHFNKLLGDKLLFIFKEISMVGKTLNLIWESLRICAETGLIWVKQKPICKGISNLICLRKYIFHLLYIISY